MIKINAIERELANTIEGRTNHYDVESKSYPRRNSSQENEVRDFSHAKPRQDRCLETLETFTIEITLTTSQERDSMMSMMHSQINRAISSAMRVISEIQNMASSLSSGNRDTKSGSSSNNQENGDGINGFKSKIAKKDCRSAFDLRETQRSLVLTV